MTTRASQNSISALAMREALKLALRTEGGVLPNPKVGAVIVFKNKIVGRGYHRGPGRAHAEVEAIRDAESRGFKKFKSSILYVTLEPCCHLKKRTPPCVPLLIQKGFEKIFVSHRDPNPKVSGEGLKQLRKAGIQIHEGLFSSDAANINQAFIKNQQKRETYITLKLAMTFDGKMADDFSNSQWITSAEAREDVHRLRREVDAIGVGARTVERDRPQLNIRLDSQKIARRIVVFGNVKKRSALKNILKANGSQNLIELATSSRSDSRTILRKLYRDYGVCHLLVEGGPKLASSFLKSRTVDELVLYMGRGILGGAGTHSLGRGWGLKSLQSSIKFHPDSVALLGPDIRIRGLFHVYRPDSKSGRNRTTRS